jgi:hypothetical protein
VELIEPRAWRCGSVVELMLNPFKALGLISRTWGGGSLKLGYKYEAFLYQQIKLFEILWLFIYI